MITTQPTPTQKLLGALKAQKELQNEAGRNVAERHGEISQGALSSWLRTLPRLTERELFDSAWRD
ncbi:MAG: hypothetical protein PHV98_00580 [Candidatus Omnitrophica bacterium]|nr:hypothetical protein [Candidatus Omnitrophota bacterium]